MNDTGFFSHRSMHLGGCMDHRFRLLIFVASLCACGGASATYGHLVPPAGYSEVLGRPHFKPAAVEVFDAITGRLLTQAEMNVGGRAVAVRTSMRLAPTAARVAAAAVIGGGAVLGTVVAVAAACAAAKLVYDVATDSWQEKYTELGSAPADTRYWSAPDVGSGSIYHPQTSYGSYTDACAALGAALTTGDNGLTQTGCTAGAFTYKTKDSWGVYGSPKSVIIYSGLICPDGASPVGGMCGDSAVEKKRPVTNDYAIDKLTPIIKPEEVAKDLPVPLPIERPVVNPSDGAEPVPQPLRVPQGEPQPVPSTNPQQYKTPVVDIVPAPTDADPWRVDLQPKDVVREDPAPLPEKEPVPVAPPAGQSVQSKPDPTPGLCDLYPDILACQKLDTPNSDELGKKEVQITLTPDSGWGGGGSCPAPRHLNGANVDFEFTMFCNFMTGIRPVVLAMAWLAAAFIVLGFKGGSD